MRFGSNKIMRRIPIDKMIRQIGNCYRPIKGIRDECFGHVFRQISFYSRNKVESQMSGEVDKQTKWLYIPINLQIIKKVK
jgi:hypothetical protein